MRRIAIPPRPDWKKRVEQQGLIYHSGPQNAAYWDESAYYEFTASEVESLESAGRELHQMFLAACEHVIQKRRFAELGIPASLHELIIKSWQAGEPELYGRFDLTFDGSQPKLIEYNADTPTSLLEASVIQWQWKDELFPQRDQFNSLHEKLVLRWKELQVKNAVALSSSFPLYLTCIADHPEVRMTLGYLGETAEQAGYQTQFIGIDQIGWNAKRAEFVDLPDQPIRQIFKLYPWEWLAVEPFAHHLNHASWRIIEPAWKSLIASKALMLILQEMYPKHPCLLPIEAKPLLEDYVRKPIFGREGRFVTFHRGGDCSPLGNNPLEKPGYIYQGHQELHRSEANYAQIGVWMVGPEACAMGVREDTVSILTDKSRFIPHLLA